MNKNSQIPRVPAQGESDVEACWSAIAIDGHSAMAAMQDGRRSGRIPENDRMASNMLIGISIRLAIGVLAEGGDDQRQSVK
jgi:hypothetical protein